MLSRRLIRIQAMKSLYSYFININTTSDILLNEVKLINSDSVYSKIFNNIIHNIGIKPEEKNLDNFNKVLNLTTKFKHDKDIYKDKLSKGLDNQEGLILKNYSFILYILIEWKKISEEIYTKMSQYNTSISKTLDTSIYFNNEIIKEIESSKYLNQIIKEQNNLKKLNETIKNWYIDILRKDTQFIKYCNSDNTDDYEFVNYITKEIILNSKIIKKYFNDVDSLWYSTKNIVKKLVTNTIDQVNAGNSNIIIDDIITKEENSFFKSLSEGVIQKWDYLLDIFESNIKNWNLDRLFYIDKILLIMGAYEILFYKTPANICINEYIEISKIYSTPKSSKFINGVLDAFIKYLEEENQTKT